MSDKTNKKKKKTNVRPTTYSTTSLEPDQSTSNGKLNIITWNINGDLEKLTIIQNEQLLISEENKRITPHVVFLQETHCVEFPEAIKQKWHVFYTQYNSTDKGVAILVNKSKCQNFQLYSQEVDSNGRYIVVKCRLVSCQEYTLVCVYNHQSDITTLDLLTPYLQKTVGTLVIGGDFNTTLGRNDRAKIITNPIPCFNKTLCSYDKKNYQHVKIKNCVERFMRNLQLVDVFRRKKGYGSFDETCFTFRKKLLAKTFLSRLDYFFIPEEWMCSVTRCEVLQMLCEDNESEWFLDHSPLLLQLENKQTEILDIQTLQLEDNPDIPPQQNQNIPLNINGVEIVAAIQSLQSCNIPDRQHMTFSPEEIKKCKHSLSSLITLYVSSRGPQNRSCMEYHVLSTILAWRLQDWGSVGGEEAHDVQVTGDEVEWHVLKDLIQKKLKHHPHKNDFNIIQKMLSSGTQGRIRLYNGCPLSCTLRKLFTI